MEKAKLLTDFITIDEALTKIRQVVPNSIGFKSYIWFPVKNKVGCLFELAGLDRNLIASVPFVTESGEIYAHPNGYTKMRVSLCFENDPRTDKDDEGWFYCETSTGRSPGKTIKRTEFLKYLQKNLYVTETVNRIVQQYVEQIELSVNLPK